MPASGTKGASLKLIAVDDDPQLLLLMEEFLEDRGHTLFSCRNQTMALPYLTEHSIDVAILDYHLERGTSRMLAGKIRLDFPRVRVILITDNQEEATVTAVQALGVDHILSKPFRLRELGAALEDLEQLEQARAAVQTNPESLSLTLYTRVDVGELNSLQAILRADPSNRNARWLLAFSYYRAQKYSNARTLLSQIVLDSSDNLLARYYLGACHYQLGDPQGALDQWQQVVRHDSIGPLAAKLRPRIEAIQKVLSEMSVPPPRPQGR